MIRQHTIETAKTFLKKSKSMILTIYKLLLQIRNSGKLLTDLDIFISNTVYTDATKVTKLFELNFIKFQ